MNKIFLTSLPLLAAVGAFHPIASAANEVKGPMAFKPIPGSAYDELTNDPAILNESTWMIPEGFKQSIVSDESDLNIYINQDWPDMNTVNETRIQAGRYLYRTHEVRPGNDQRNDGKLGGTVSVVDLRTGIAKELAAREDWEALDGLVWTPWHTLLVAEETNSGGYPDPDYPLATGGLVYEIELEKKDPATAKKVTARPLLGSIAHEGIETDDEGNVYVIDEDRAPGGSIFKFVPDNYGDLSSGKLFALRVKNGGQTGEAEWVELQLDPVTFDAQVAAEQVGATSYCRPEDLERIGKTLYAALTCEPRIGGKDGPGAVLAISLNEMPMVSYFVEAGINIATENKAAGITGLKSPDNLANGPDGKLWIVEDNVPSDIWVAEPDNDGDGHADGVHLFASLKDSTAEGTGIYFGKNPQKLFVNVQHSGTGNDKTMEITKIKKLHKSDKKHND
ncbi:MAG: PhoX family protein [Methylobacter sp.]|uniref:alkaline phosphatase PhoX n=1 Tax=Methylobacter sp. TaxID=2051955 RepID=UPI002589805C|nr:alkaline phosphatase PhoX [Methylobacter sp.]MCL7422320.1 PhoX family protein [Methylobacter sp.]